MAGGVRSVVPGAPRRPPGPLRTPLQVAATFVLGLGVPFGAYAAAGAAGTDLAGAVYPIVVAALLLTAAAVWTEGLLALRPARPPRRPAAPYPPASAVIAAYLPNEAATVVATVRAFLALDYPGPLQVVLAYNTPRPMLLEQVLARIARADPRLVPLHVAGSTSKAENVTAALAVVTGEFVGIFDADHLPDAGSFRRAWRWLSHGWDVVQGHPVVRNGPAAPLARLVAVEFEAIYAVGHPGRGRLHGFGLFGGSTGFWRTDVLRATGMRPTMLTEDIDASLRAVRHGARIVADPALVSSELAPTTLRVLWHQRMRWAQGWFQVSLHHLGPGLRSPHLGLRQKAGLAFLLGWREVYPWVSLQVYPILAHQALLERGSGGVDWLVPVFVLTTLLTLSVGPWQTVFAYRAGHPSIRRHGGWFLAYLVLSVPYAEWKNTIARVAQLKELMGERRWTVTPRRAPDRTPARRVPVRPPPVPAPPLEAA